MRATLRWAAVGVCLLMWEASFAQGRRGGQPSQRALFVELQDSVAFGLKIVRPGKYRLILGKGKFALANPRTMVVQATVPVQMSVAKSTAPKPTATLERKGKQVSITLHNRDNVYTAIGVVVAGATTNKTKVKLAGKKEETVDGTASEVTPQQKQLEKQLQDVVDRYERFVDHCGDAAKRNRWETDDPKFVRCVCPIAEKWRLPKVPQETLIHRPLLKAKNGFSIRVSPEGKVTHCRVWTGHEPPAPKPTEPEEEANDGKATPPKPEHP